RAHGARLSGVFASPATSPEDLEGLVQAGVQGLDSWLAAAVTRSPFDLNKPAEATVAPAAASTATAPAPAKPAATAAPAAAAPATTPAASAPATTTAPAPPA